MNKLDLNSLTKEQIEKAMAMECKTPEELMELAKKGGIEITKAEAEAYLDELQDFELDPETLKKVAGGNLICNSEQGEPCTEQVSSFGILILWQTSPAHSG